MSGIIDNINRNPFKIKSLDNVIDKFHEQHEQS